MKVKDVCISAGTRLGYDMSDFEAMLEDLPPWARDNLEAESADPEGEAEQLARDATTLMRRLGVEAALAPTPVVLDPAGVRARPRGRTKGRPRRRR